VILSPEASQLFRIFILRAPGKQKLFVVPTIFRRGKLNIILWLIIWILLATRFASSLMWSEQTYREFTKPTESDSLVGFWTVKSVRSDNGDQQKYFDKWLTLSISGQKYASVSFRNGQRVWLTWKTSDDQKQVDLGAGKQSNWSMHCEIERPDPEHIVLRSAEKTIIQCERLQRSDFLLLNRGFHWVNETPFNK